MKQRSLLLRIAILFFAIAIAGGYIGYRAWSASQSETVVKPEELHFGGSKSAEILPPDAVQPANESPKPEAKEEPPPEVFHGSKSAPVFEPSKRKPHGQTAQQVQPKGA